MLKMELFSDKFYQEWDYLLLVLQDVIVVVLNKVSKYRSYKSSCTRKYLKEVFKSKIHMLFLFSTCNMYSILDKDDVISQKMMICRCAKQWGPMYSIML